MSIYEYWDRNQLYLSAVEPTNIAAIMSQPNAESYTLFKNDNLSKKHVT